MGRERQKFKNRSSVPKKRQKPKSKKKILQNPIVAAHWNQKETLAQNYKRLGLTSRLNHVAGGTEKLGQDVQSSDEEEEGGVHKNNVARTKDVLDISRKLPTTLDVTEVRVTRDPTTGAIVSVDDEAAPKPNPLNDPLNDMSDGESEDGWEGFVNEHGLLPSAAEKRRRRDGQQPQAGSVAGVAETPTETVRQLEEAASRPVVRRERGQSAREKEWVERMVGRYGDDYRKMSRDHRLNAMQQSEGDIRRRVERWRKLNVS